MEYWKELRKKVGHDKIMLNCVGAAIFNGKGQVLLQKRSEGTWGFPGGVMELDESFEEAVIREVREETGLLVSVKRLIGIYSKYSDSYANGDVSQPISAFFECLITGGKPECDNDETLELQYFDLNDAPELFNKQHRDMLNDLRASGDKCYIR